MKKFPSVVWTISAILTIGLGLMFFGALTADAINVYAGIASVSFVIFIASSVIAEIDRRAFDRGYETADSIRVKEQQEQEGWQEG